MTIKRSIVSARLSNTELAWFDWAYEEWLKEQEEEEDNEYVCSEER